MASELLSASLRADYQQDGKRWSDLIDPNVGARLDHVKWGTACNVGFATATATVLGPDGGELLPEGEAAAILYWWNFAVLRIYMRGETAYVGRIWEIELGELVDDEHLGPARTVTISLQGIAYDLALRIAAVPGEMTQEFATVSVTDMIKEAIERQGSIIAPNFDQLGPISVDAGQISATLGDYWLDLIIRALQTGDSNGIEWTFLVYEPEAGPVLLARGQGPARWLYPAVGAGVGVKWSGHEYASLVIANFTRANNSAESTEPTESEEALLFHHNVPAGRTINVTGTSRSGAEAAAATALALRTTPIAPTGPLTITPDAAPYAELPGPERQREPGWRVRAGQVIDLQGLLPSDNRWRHMRAHNIESTEYDDDTGTLTITLDQRRVRSRADEQSVDIRRMWSVLAPSRPRGLVVMFQTFDDDYAITDPYEVVDTIGEAGQCVFTLPMDTEVKVKFSGLITPLSATGRLTLGIDFDGEDFAGEEDRMARTRIGSASTEPITLEGTHRRWLNAGEHTLQLWAESQSGLAGSVLNHALVIVEG